MAQTEHLPIYKAAYDLCLHLEQAVGRFGRAHRYGIGAELREGARGGCCGSSCARTSAPPVAATQEEVEAPSTSP